MRKLEHSEIQKLELEILLYFDEFCKQHGLTYYLAGGTLLGAIRHKGFIPWDDDIDVCMPRNDYVKMVMLLGSIDDKKYKLKSNLLGHYVAPYTNLINSLTKIDCRFSDETVDNSLWIDIFPVDGLPEDVDLVSQIYRKCDFFRRMLLLNDAKIGEGKTFFRKCAKYIAKPIARLYGRRRCIEQLEKIATQYSYDECKYVGVITWGLHGIGERMLKSEFEQPVEVEFEGHLFPIFSCWEEYLKGLYGEYMKMPPVEERTTHDMVAYLIERD
ncbi:MAG: LicD family protein [Acidaminococcaceae bacterium]|nr:LicD family protein [Acidaminococcaceae bacterium]